MTENLPRAAGHRHIHYEGRLSESRVGQITRWEDAPSVRLLHPREEHFPPLTAAAGAMLSPGIRQFRNSVLETAISCVAFAW